MIINLKTKWSTVSCVTQTVCDSINQIQWLFIGAEMQINETSLNCQVSLKIVVVEIGAKQWQMERKIRTLGRFISKH